MQRRLFIKSVLACGVIAALPACTSNSALSRSNNTEWDYVARLKQQIHRATFQDYDVNVADFGALADNHTNNGKAFKLAIAACASAGGGRVIVPAGEYLTGPIHLLSNVNFHLLKGAVLRFIAEPTLYLPAVLTRWEGVEMMGYSPLIYAYEQENIAVSGEGLIDGGANDNTWWPWKGAHKEAHWRQDAEEFTQKAARTKLFEQAEAGIAPEQRMYAHGSYLRPALLQTYRCRKVLIEGVTLTNSPFWLIHPVLCTDVVISGVTCRSHGPNNDGCDPESCNRVLIEHCIFDTGDDCIALKSGRNADGRRLNVPVQNVIVEQCQMKDGHGGLVIGSEISGGAHHIFMRNCEMSSPELERAIRIKTNSVRGGVIENIYIKDVNVGQVKDAIVINFYYEEGDAGQFDPLVRNLFVDNLQVDNADRALLIKGFARSPIVNFNLKNSHFKRVNKPHVVEHVEQLNLEHVFVADIPLLAKDLVSL
jgi:polygalacturonase